MRQQSLLEFRVTREEIRSAFEPFVRSHFHASDLRWKRRVIRSGLKRIYQYWMQRIFPSLEKSSESQHEVKQAYEKKLGETIINEHLSREGKTTLCLWDNDRMLARGIGTKRVHLLLLKRAIETVNPENILEVGSGYGINLFVLAGYFPGIPFSGTELTRQGVIAAKRIREMPCMPKEIIDFAQDSILDTTAHKRVNFSQGNAKELPFPDKSFDVVYTVLALEAMEGIRHQAIRELARVARRYVLMVEPFLDFNERGIRYYYHSSSRYFRGKIDELPQDGLEPLLVYSDIPHKVRLWTALVIARPI